MPKLNPKMVVALAALVIAVVAGFGFLVMREPPVRQAPLAQSGVGADISPNACAEVLSPGYAFNNYEKLRESLAKGVMDPETKQLASCFIDTDITGLNPDELYKYFLSNSFNSSVYYDYISQSLTKTIAAAQQDAKRRSRLLAWGSTFSADGAILAYVRTGEERFLDLFVRYFDEVVRLRDSEVGLVDDVHNRIVKAWGDGDEAEGHRFAHVTQAARITYPATEFARIVKGNPELQHYASTAQRYVDATIEALGEFDEDYRSVPGQGISYFISPSPIDKEAEPTNHVHLVGKTYLNLYALTGDKRYRDRSDNFIAIFKKGVKSDSDGNVYWAYYPYFLSNEKTKTEPAEMLWKASLTVPFVYMAYQCGLDVDQNFVEAIADTFLNRLVVNNQLSRDLSGKDKLTAEDDRLANAYGFVQWLDYSAVRPEIADRVRTMIATRRDLFPRGWFTRVNLAYGYAFFLPSPMKSANAASGKAADHPN